jgi:hypothetical protein
VEVRLLLRVALEEGRGRREADEPLPPRDLLAGGGEAEQGDEPVAEPSSARRRRGEGARRGEEQEGGRPLHRVVFLHQHLVPIGRPCRQERETDAPEHEEAVHPPRWALRLADRTRVGVPSYHGT